MTSQEEDDVEEWRVLYQETFGYRQPLFHPEHAVFEFQQEPKFTGHQRNEELNPWKEAYEQLSRGVHVMNSLEQFVAAADIQCFDHIEEALKFLDENPEGHHEKLIFLHEGTHIVNHTIRIASDVQILGASSSEDIASSVILTGRHATILEFQEGANSAYLGYITVKYEVDTEHEAEVALIMEVDALEGGPGHPEPARLLPPDEDDDLEKVHGIESDPTTNCAMVVTGRGMEPTIERCNFQSGNPDSHTVVVKDHAAPKMKNSTCIGGCGGGIIITHQATGYFENCEFSHNLQSGVRVQFHANPYFYNCRIHHQGDVGIFVLDDGLGHFQNCEIFTNNKFGIELKSPQSNPTITECEIHHGRSGGICVHEEATGQFLKNRIHNNEFLAVWISDRANPVVRQNEISDGKHGGIYIHSFGKGLIEDNEIHGNVLAGVFVETGGEPYIRNNHFHSGKQAGVYFYDGGCGVLEGNEINGNSLTGVQIRTGANPRIIKNRIWNNDNGVLVHEEGLGCLEENTIFDNSMTNLYIKTEATPIVRKNKIFGSKGTGVSITDRGKGTIEDNEIFDNAQAGVLVLSDASPIIRLNRVHGNKSAGIEVSSKGDCVVRENRVFRNRFGGIMSASNTIVSEDHNQVYDNLNLVSKAINQGHCLFSVSGKEFYPMHDFYRCITCNSSERNSICQSCIERCHKGHVVTFLRCDRFYCDCGADHLEQSCCLRQS
uniref:UBR-type domain-containing protein n=1 Tax=Caenorhabditis tropicalis TaxID=1561998 RepID=A0A1I7UXF0_9PELO